MTGSLVEERRQLLGLLINAYLGKDTPILVTESHSGMSFIHPLLPKALPTNWSHLEALAMEERIYLTGHFGSTSVFFFFIPSQVIADLEAGDRDILGLAPGNERIAELIGGNTFHNYFASTAVQNIAVESPGSSFGTSLQVAVGDFTTLSAALEKLNLPQDQIELLRAAIEESSQNDRRSSVMKWFQNLTSGAMAGLFVSGVESNAIDTLEWLRQIASAVSSFGISL